MEAYLHVFLKSCKTVNNFDLNSALQVLKETKTLMLGYLYRVAQKTWNGILPAIGGCNKWYECMNYEVTSPEKNDTKISNFGSVVSLVF